MFFETTFLCYVYTNISYQFAYIRPSFHIFKLEFKNWSRNNLKLSVNMILKKPKNNVGIGNFQYV